MSKEFRLQISTPKKVCLDKEVTNVTIPTAKGYVGILSNHAKIIGAINPGYMHITLASGEKQVALINYGVYTFKNNKLVILSDFFEFEKSINENAIQAISDVIKQEIKKVQLSDHSIHALNSYMKMINEKAIQKK